MQPKIGDAVLYSAMGRKAVAIVLASRSGEVSHLGANGEPILTLAFIDPARETGLAKDKEGNYVYPVGRLPIVHIEHDVVHASHEFSEAFFKEKRINAPTPAVIASLRGHGEWSEYAGAAQDVVNGLRASLKAAADLANANGDQAAREKARADKAEYDLKAEIEKH